MISVPAPTGSHNSAPQSASNTAPRPDQQTLRWVLAHEPPVVFEDASAEFARQIEVASEGAIGVEVYQNEAFTAYRGGESVSRTELVRCVQRGEIEMAHCYVAALGAFSDPLWAIELPFLFRDYDHAEAVFEGPVGERLMNGLLPQGLRGLAFAYSGGLRIVPTTGRRLESLEDYAGFRLRTSGNPVPQALYQSLGAQAHGASLDDIAPMTRAGTIEGCEITYVRFQATGLDRVFHTINETHHSLFTTMTIVNEQWFQGLRPSQRALITEAARSACRSERQVAIQEEARTRDHYAAQGLTITRMAPEQKQRLQAAAQHIHEAFKPRFGADLIEDIRQAGC